jgi:hypothetical protein
MNRVLTLEEIMALDEGARLWVETSTKSEYGSMIHYRTKTHAGDDALKDSSGGYYPITPEWYGDEYRVWSLPVAPTPDELAAWPWEA